MIKFMLPPNSNLFSFVGTLIVNMHSNMPYNLIGLKTMAFTNNLSQNLGTGAKT